MSNKLFRIQIIQPEFDKLYKKYQRLFSQPKIIEPLGNINTQKEESTEKTEIAQKLEGLINKINELKKTKRLSSEHVRWIASTKKLLKLLTGEKSDYSNTFNSLTWRNKQGVIGGPSRQEEVFNPQLGIDRLNNEAYLEQLELAKGILLAVKDELHNLPILTGVVIFPKELCKKLPSDVSEVCEEFNYNFINGKPWASFLLLRRLLPLSIVRKFQTMDKEAEIKTEGEYLETKPLLGMVEKYLKEKKIYKDIMNYKNLTDSSQHSFTFSPELTDVEGVALKMRLLLDDLFS